MEERLKTFLSRYLGQGTQKKDIVTQEAIDLLVMAATIDHFEQDIIDYGTTHPDAQQSDSIPRRIACTRSSAATAW